MEHPVTEMISSVDLIEEQIRVARGEKLRYKQVWGKVTYGSVESQSFIFHTRLLVSGHRKILCLEGTLLNAVLTQKMLSKTSDLGQVWLSML